MSTLGHGYAVSPAHCIFGPHGIRTLHTHDAGRIAVPVPYLAAATIVQTGQALASLLFRCDLPPNDPRLPVLVSRLLEIVPVLRELIDQDPARTVIVDFVDRGAPQWRAPGADTFRSIFAQAFLRNAAAGAA